MYKSLIEIFLETFFRSFALGTSPYRATHTADAVRLLLIYKYGGMYLDLDYVVLRDLTHYKNMLLEEGETPGKGKLAVTNSAFMFTAKHPFLLAAMKALEERYNKNCWDCIGPKLLTGVAKNMTNATMINDIPASANINVTPMKRMMPVKWNFAQRLYFPEKPVSFKTWEKMFQHSSTVHFFGKMTECTAVRDDPRYSAYAVLGPRYCPHAYYSTKHL